MSNEIDNIRVGGPITCTHCGQAYNCATDIHVCSSGEGGKIAQTWNTVIDVPVPNIDKSKPDATDEQITLVLAGLLIPSQQLSWVMARELQRRREEEKGNK